MKENEVKLNPPWKELVNVAMGWRYGSKHSHDEIAEVLGLEYGSIDYYHNVNSANDELISIGKRLKNIQGEGYRVLKPEEQTPEVVFDIRGVMRRFREALFNLNGVPIKELDDTHKEIHEHVGISLSRTYSTVASGYTEAAALAGIQRKQKMLSKGIKKEIAK